MPDLAIIFPGQGAQYVGMGKDLAEAHNVCRDIYQRANDVLGYDLAKLCFAGPEEELKRTINTQPALLTTSLAVFELVKDLANEPLVMAGHSLGEYTALAAAGAFSLETAVALVSKRAEFMMEAVAEGVGGMAAVLGLEEEQVAQACDQAAGEETVVVANINSPGQVVISGHLAAVGRACEVAKELGAKRAIPLVVSGPFHSPLLQPAAEKMSALLQEKKEAGEIQASRVPVVANYSAEPIQQADEIVNALGIQVDHSVRWLDSVQKMGSLGAKKFLEVGPKVLGPMVKKILPEAEFTNVKDAASLEEYRAKTQG